MRMLIINVLLVILLLFSCKNEQKEKVPFVNKWEGKQVIFPNNLVFTRYVADTLDFQIPQVEHKVLIYVDSTGCTGCKLQLHKWKDFMQLSDSLAQGKVFFLFFFHPKDRIELQYLLKGYEIDIPVCLDIEDRLNKLNHFPVDTVFQTFLLDRNDRVLLKGNPIHDVLVREMYLDELTGKKNFTMKVLNTTAEVIQKEIDFGIINKSETKEATIDVKNAGRNPLVILDVSTICGCMETTYDKQPAQIGESLRVIVKTSFKDTGFFDKVLTINYNSTNNQPVKVRIKGNVR